VLPQVRHLQERLAVSVALLQRQLLRVQLEHLAGDLRLARRDRLGAEHVLQFHEPVLGEVGDRGPIEGVVGLEL
jgi:hypothetical protein